MSSRPNWATGNRNPIKEREKKKVYIGIEYNTGTKPCLAFMNTSVQRAVPPKGKKKETNL